MSLLCFVKMSRMTIEYWSSMASIETCSWPSWVWMWDSWCPRMMCEGHLSQIGINHYHCNRLLTLTLARILIMRSSDMTNIIVIVAFTIICFSFLIVIVMMMILQLSIMCSSFLNLFTFVITLLRCFISIELSQG